MRSAIRLDDITPDMDWGKYGKIEKILEENDLKPLIGVVPFNKDENLNKNNGTKTDGEFREYLAERSQKGWSIALHGYNHIYSNKKKGIFPLNNFSEYAGVSLEKQVRMLSEGRARLLMWGVDTDIFMAPAHSFDKNTLKALNATGFYRITDGFGRKPYNRNGITFYPISRHRAECTSDIPGYTTLVLHTNTMTEADIEGFEVLVKENIEHFISYNEYLEVPPVYRGVVGNFAEYITALAKFCIVRLRSRQ